MGIMETSALVFATTSIVLCVLYCGAILRAHRSDIERRLEGMERDNFESYDRIRTLVERTETTIGVRISEAERHIASLEGCSKTTQSR
jgi:hypothetical protein